MRLIDIHTHNKEREASILNCSADEDITHICSVGLHPWDIGNDWKSKIAGIEKRAADSKVVAIGECGFDYIKGAAAKELQESVFMAHIDIAERSGKPLIVHIVKGEQELLKAAKRAPHNSAWIIHGFRGKQQQAEQLLRAGFYLSFGEKFNSEALLFTPVERLFIESDESKQSIAEIYSAIAKIKGVSIDELARHIEDNARRCNIDIQQW